MSCVHGQPVVSGNVIHGHDVGNAMRVVPDPFWIITKGPLPCDVDCTSVTVHSHGDLGGSDVSEQLLVQYEIGGGTAVEQYPSAWKHSPIGL